MSETADRRRARVAEGQMMYPSTEHIRQAANASRYSHRFFSDDNLSRWKTRVLPDVYDARAQGAFFVTSDQPDGQQHRVYSVYLIDVDGNVHPVDGDLAIAPGIEMTRIPTLAHAKSQASIIAATVIRSEELSAGEGGRG